MKYISKSAVIVLVASFGLSQNIESKSKEDLFNSIQFGITDKFTLGTFEGTLISYKRHLSEQNAIRIGFSATIDNESTTSKDYYPTKDILDDIDNREMNYNEYEVSIQYLRFSKLNNKLRYYYGIGPIMVKSKSSSKSNRTNYYYDPDTTSHTINESDYASKGFGLFGTFGFEWNFNENIRFIAEYGATYIEGESKYTYEYKYMSSENKSFDLDNKDYKRLEPREINFGLSFYF